MIRVLQVTTPSDLEIVMTREFNAPRRLVWEAMTDPRWIRRWIYAPEGWKMTVCEGGLNVGDAFCWAWNGPDGQPAMTIRGVTRELVPCERAVHTEIMEVGGVALGELLATIELNEQDDQTLLRMTLLFPSREARDGAIASGMERGVSAGYQQLDVLLSTEAGR